MEDGAGRRDGDARKYVVCNADEGDSGTFSDRMIMEGDPFVLIEGMTIAAIAVGATQGYIYLRSEYPHARARWTRRSTRHTRRGCLGANVRGSGKAFDAGSFASAPARTSAARKPRCSKVSRASAGWCVSSRRFPRWRACSASRPDQQRDLVRDGADHPRTRRGPFTAITAPATRAARYRFKLAGNVEAAGTDRKASLGVTLREIVDEYGGGTASGQTGSRDAGRRSAGRVLSDAMLDTAARLTSRWRRRAESWATAESSSFDDTVDMAQMARYAMEFCAIESCGKCTPCRIGSIRGTEVIDDIVDRTPLARESRCAPRPLRHDEARLAMRARRPHAAAGDECAEIFSAGFRV